MIEKNAIVSYLFGETPRYRVIATKEEPYMRQNEQPLVVRQGMDYVIVPDEFDGEFTPFLHVPKAHVELIA